MSGSFQMHGSSSFKKELWFLQIGEKLMKSTPPAASRRLKAIGSLFKGRQQLKAANATAKCKILFHMGDTKKHLPGYLRTDEAKILYKYQMYDQSKFSKSLSDLEPKTIFWSERWLYTCLRFWIWREAFLEQLHTIPSATFLKKISSLL